MHMENRPLIGLIGLIYSDFNLDNSYIAESFWELPAKHAKYAKKRCLKIFACFACFAG